MDNGQWTMDNGQANNRPLSILKIRGVLKMETIIWGIYVFAVGLIFGSFFNVCIYRIPKEESVAFPPSHCPNCSNKLKPLDLIPVFSYLFLKGKCRYCGEKISPRYALVELFTGIIFLLLFLEYGISFVFFKYVILSSFLIIIGIIDYDTTDVYFKITLTGVVIGVILMLAGFVFHVSILDAVLGAFLGGGVIFLIVFLTKGMGEGDIEICLLSGLYLGLSKTTVLLFLSFVIGGIIGILLLILKKKTRKDYIPFGPFIAAAGVITMLLGDKIINWYLNLIFMRG